VGGPQSTSTTSGVAGNTQNDSALHNETFFQNKSLVGGVFAVVGIVVLILVVVIATGCIRRRRRQSLEDEIVQAVSWQPHNFQEDAGHDTSNYGGEKGDLRSETGSVMTQGYGAQPYGQRSVPPPAMYQQQGAGYGQAQYPFSTPYAVQQYQTYPAAQYNVAAQTAAAMALPDHFGNENGLARSGTLTRGNDTLGENLTVANE